MLTAFALMSSTRAISRGGNCSHAHSRSSSRSASGSACQRLVERAVERVARVVLRPVLAAPAAAPRAPGARRCAGCWPGSRARRRRRRPAAPRRARRPGAARAPAARRPARRRRSRGRCGGAGTAGPARRRRPPAPRTAVGGRGRRLGSRHVPVCPDRPRIFRRRDGGTAIQPVGVASAVGVADSVPGRGSPAVDSPRAAVARSVGALLPVGSAEPVEPEVPSPSTLPSSVPSRAVASTRRRRRTSPSVVLPSEVAVRLRRCRRRRCRCPGRRPRPVCSPESSACSWTTSRIRCLELGEAVAQLGERHVLDARAELLQLGPDRGQRLAARPRSARPARVTTSWVASA